MPLGNQRSTYFTTGIIPGTYRTREDVIIPLAGDPEDPTFRQIARRGRKTGRDLSPVKHDQMIGYSFEAWRKNPLAKRIIETMVNFVLGSGISVSSDDEDTLVRIQAHWENPYNNWPYMIYQRLRDLLIYGEWVMMPIVNDQGDVYINDIQPEKIKETHIDDFNHSQVDSVIFKAMIGTDGTLHKDVEAPVIRRRLDFNTGKLLPYSGDVFLFGINRTTDSTRGVGELFPLIDIIDLFDSVVFSRAEKIELLSQIYYDVELPGMDSRQIQEWLSQQANVPPSPGSVWAHNEQVKMEAKVPDLRADDHVKDLDAIHSYVVEGAGWPGTFFDSPGSAGRAVGAEMSEPAFKNVTVMQRYIGQIFRIILDYSLQMAATADKEFTPEPYWISFARPSTRDFARIGPALARVSQFIKTVRGAELTQAETRELVVLQLNQLGLTDRAFQIELPVELKRAMQTVQPVPGSNGSKADPSNAAAETVPKLRHLLF